MYKLLDKHGAEYLSTEKGTFGGHRKQKIYGRLDCPSALRWLAKGFYAQHRVFFKDEATAIAAGYRPCAVCMPKEYKAWKEKQEAKFRHLTEKELTKERNNQMFKTTFTASGCSLEAEIKTNYTLGTSDTTEFDDITIRLLSDANVELGRVHALRIPSSYRKTASDLYGIYYTMGFAMAAYNKDLTRIALDAELSANHTPFNAVGRKLTEGDLYYIYSVSESPLMRDAGILEWMYNNMTTMISKVTHDLYPVCVTLEPESNKCIKPAIFDCGWKYVSPGASTIYQEV